MSQPLWSPSPERVAAARMTAFRALAAKTIGRPLPDYDALYAWSVAEPEAFWPLVWQFTGLQASTPWTQVRGEPRMPGTTWFQGACLNFAENLLRWNDDGIALVMVDERGSRQGVTYAELTRRVASFQGWLSTQGVGVGDRVAAFMPNRIETVVAMLAATGLGATFSSCSPDFGLKGVLDRFGQIRPTVLVACDGARYGGKEHATLDRVRQIVAALPGLAATVIVPVLGEERLEGSLLWSDAQDPSTTEPHFEQLPFDHPLYIMYSSGTTGVPKCIVHGAGGTLLQHAKELVLHNDLGRDDTLFYFTTCGWMMWNWLVSGLVTGGTVVLFDGSPAFPTADVLWQMAEDAGVTVFGTSPKFLSTCEKAGLRPGADHDLSRLKAVLSTGAPLSVENFRWVYDAVKTDVQLASISGGTDIISCFMLGSPVDPVWPGEIQKRGLGMAVEAWRGEGQPVIGEKAELVCTAPFPSMPVSFWDDPEGLRYHDAYFDHFEGVWRHGDFIEITERGGVIVYGRSDATLNPGGVRIGTAEIYRPVEAMPEVREALVVGLPKDDDIEVVLFVVLADGVGLDDDLTRRIRARIRRLASPRHVPSRIVAAPAIPRTISGKKVEIAVTRILQGQDAPNRDALANPEALAFYASL